MLLNWYINVRVGFIYLSIFIDFPLFNFYRLSTLLRFAIKLWQMEHPMTTLLNTVTAISAEPRCPPTLSTQATSCPSSLDPTVLWKAGGLSWNGQHAVAESRTITASSSLRNYISPIRSIWRACTLLNPKTWNRFSYSTKRNFLSLMGKSVKTPYRYESEKLLGVFFHVDKEKSNYSVLSTHTDDTVSNWDNTRRVRGHRSIQNFRQETFISFSEKEFVSW